MSFMKGYVPKVPDREAVSMMSKDMIDNMMVDVFEGAMPQVHDHINKLIGKVSEDFRENDSEVAEELDRLSIKNSDAANIFVNYVLPEYENIINTPEELEDVDNGNIEVDSERTESLVSGD